MLVAGHRINALRHDDLQVCPLARRLGNSVVKRSCLHNGWTWWGSIGVVCRPRDRLRAS